MSCITACDLRETSKVKLGALVQSFRRLAEIEDDGTARLLEGVGMFVLRPQDS